MAIHSGPGCLRQPAQTGAFHERAGKASRRLRGIGALAVLAVALLLADQATAQDARALWLGCRDDYRRFCGGLWPGGGAILDCLRQHVAALSAQCRGVIAPSSGPAASGDSLDGEGEEGTPGGRIALPAAASLLPDVAYGADALQRMDVYLPANPRGAPVLFMVHGGAWMLGDKTAAGVVASKVARWLPRGYILVSVNYRLLPAADPLEQADDVARALAAAQSKARSWGGDPARFVLMGHSAGAHLVALLAADPAIAARHGAMPWLGTVALDSAAFDIAEIMRRPHFRFYDRAFGSDPAFWRDASPIHRLAARPAPVLLVCSSRRASSCAQAQGFAGKTIAQGGQATVLPVDLSHGEINRSLGLSGSYTEAVETFLRSLGLP